MLERNDIHYRLYEELDTYLETGYCSFWRLNHKFIKPTIKSIKNNLLEIPFIGGYYLILEGKLEKEIVIKIFYDKKKYYYHYYDNNELKEFYSSNDYLEIHKIIEYKMEQ